MAMSEFISSTVASRTVTMKMPNTSRDLAAWKSIHKTIEMVDPVVDTNMIAPMTIATEAMFQIWYPVMRRTERIRFRIAIIIFDAAIYNFYYPNFLLSIVILVA